MLVVRISKDAVLQCCCLPLDISLSKSGAVQCKVNMFNQLQYSREVSQSSSSCKATEFSVSEDRIIYKGFSILTVVCCSLV